MLTLKNIHTHTHTITNLRDLYFCPLTKRGEKSHWTNFFSVQSISIVNDVSEPSIFSNYLPPKPRPLHVNIYTQATHQSLRPGNRLKKKGKGLVVYDDDSRKV